MALQLRTPLTTPPATRPGYGYYGDSGRCWTRRIAPHWVLRWLCKQFMQLPARFMTIHTYTGDMLIGGVEHTLPF